MDFELVNFEHAAQMARALAEVLRRHAQAAAAPAAAVMLTGGTTVRPAYRRFAAAGPAPAPAGFYLLGSDERHVPHTDDASNYPVMTPVWQALALPPARILMPDPCRPLADAAARYHADLAAFFATGGRITLGLLGLGADGHVASLFTREDVERGRDNYAVAVPRPAPPDRVSVTPALLARVELTIVLTAGPAKRAALTRLLSGAADMPAVRALAGAPQVLLWHAVRE